MAANISANLDSLASLLVAVTSVITGAVILIGNRRSKINISYALLIFILASWSMFRFIWTRSFSSAEENLFWLRALMALAIFIPAAYLQFIYTFLGILDQKKSFLKSTYLFFLIFFILDFTPLFLKTVETTSIYQFRPVPGYAFHIFLLAWLLCVIYSTYLLFKAYRQADGIRKQQIKYILIGWIIGFIGGSTNYLLFYNLPWMPFGIANWSILAYILATFYAIAKLNLLNIKVVTTEFLTFFIWISLIIRFFLTTSLIEQILNGSVLVLVIILGILIIRSALNEAKQKDELTSLTKELKNLNEHLEQRVSDQTEEIRRAYSVEKKARLEIEALDKTKSQFILTTQHHLRTPLTIFRGFINKVLANKKDKINDQNKIDLQKASVAADRMANLINEFLDITQLEIGQTTLRLQSVDLQKIIKDIYEDFFQELEKKSLIFKAEFSEAASTTKINADPGKIKIALYNLIDNAIKYTEKGSITIKADVITHPIEHFKALRIIVKDTGIGIPTEELPQLFHLYFQRGAVAEKIYTTGRGIGLTLAKDIIEAHQGKITAESEGSGKGTSFIVELPV